MTLETLGKVSSISKYYQINSIISHILCLYLTVIGIIFNIFFHSAFGIMFELVTVIYADLYNTSSEGRLIKSRICVNAYTLTHYTYIDNTGVNFP